MALEMNRRQVLRSALMVGGGIALGGTFSACGSGSGGGGSATSLRTIGEALPPFENLAELSKQFTAETGIALTIEPYVYETALSKTIFDFTSNQAQYDFVMGIYQELGKYAGNGMITPIDDMLAIEPYPIDLSVFSQSVLDAGCRYDGKTFGLPCTAQTMYLWYRKDLFQNPEEQRAFTDKYGYDLPVPSADNVISFDQFRDLAEFFTRRQGEQLAGETLSSDFFGTCIQGKRHVAVVYEFLNYIGAWGGSILGQDGSVAIDSPEVVEALEFYVGLKKFSPPGTGEYTFDDALVAMQQGNIALCIMWFDAAPELEDESKSKVAGKVGYAPNPKKVNLVHTFGGWNWYVNADSKKHKETLSFMRWTNQEDVALEWMKVGGLPSRSDVLQSGAYKEIVWNGGREVALDNVIGIPSNITWASELMDAMALSLSSAVAGTKDPQTAITELAQALETLNSAT